MVKFSRIAGAEMRWRYMKKHSYGWGRTGSRPLRKPILDKLTAAFVDMGFMCQLGTPSAIVSAGAWVPESARRGPTDKHVQGRAIDIDALHWSVVSGTMESPRILLTQKYPDYPAFYLGVEACFRRYFGTVLGWLYNNAHKGHWHIDDGSKVCYRASSESRVKFVQASLHHIWHVNVGSHDGKVGSKTRAGIKRVREFLNLTKPLTDAESWQRYLMATAITGMSKVDSLDRSL
jgi:hypothetical protein